MGLGGHDMEIFKNFNSSWHYKILILVLILVSGLAIACNNMPNKVIGENDSFIVYLKEDGLYFSSLNNGEETKIHSKFENLTVLPYKDNLSINPKDNNLIGLIEGGYREMVFNKKVVLYDISSGKTDNIMYLMDKDLVAMTPSFTLDGDKLLYSATEGVDIARDFIDYNKAFEDWEVGPHHIYEYDLKTSQVKNVTEGDYFDFIPISISKDEILFSRYKGNGFFSLIKLVNGKEDIIADNIIFDYHNEGRAFGFYGHIGTEKAMDIYLNMRDEDFENAENQYTNNIKKVEVIFNEDNPHFNGVKPISITDKKMLNDIINMLKDSKPIQDDEKMGKMSGMSYKDILGL